MTLAQTRDVAAQEPASRPPTPKRRPGRWKRSLRRDWPLYTFAIAPLIFLAIFRYLPMLGNVIAFRRFRPGGNIFGDEWVGMLYVDMFIHDPAFWNVFTNTVIIGGMTLVVCFPLPIILALMLNEVRRTHFKKIVQSISYLPHFLSVVIVVGMVYQLLSLQGTVNQITEAFGGDAVSFLQKPEWFRFIYVASEAWQTVGWGTILYLAALTAVDDGLYEASRIDGANRWQQTWHVTIPGIRPTWSRC
ncbi:Xylose ABC transporter, permease component [Corynebacterium xerosis]|nr:Xylose ABC transporter, permease component [Corynebacterium xerosis]